MLLSFFSRFCNIKERCFFGLILFSLYFYSFPIYATCSGLGCSCTVSPSPTAVTFGNYNPISATATTATGNIAVSCSSSGVMFTPSYVISLNAGNSGSFTTRFMNLSSNRLNYNLFTTAARTTIWGDGTAGTGTISDSYTSLGLTTTRNYTVYGSIPALQTVRAGTYTDTITVTVTY